MKQLAQYQDGRLELQDVPVPVAPPGGILVRVAHSVISPGTEKMKVEQARMSLLEKARARPDQVRKVLETARTLGWKAALAKVRNRLESPTPLGYSAAGVVVAVDELNTRFHVGDRVACGGAECAHHADLIAVPDLLAARVPMGVELWQAAYTTLASISMEAVRQSDARLGERVLVIGQGLVGLLATSLLKAAGARVMAVDYAPARLQKALAMGAERAVDPATSKVDSAVREWTDGQGVDAVLLCAGGKGAEAADQAIACLRDRGVLVIVGMYDAELTWKTAYMKDIQVRYSRSYGPGRYDAQYEWGGRDYPIGHVRWTENRNFDACLQLMKSGALNLEPVTTRRAAFADAVSVYDELMRDGNADVGVVLEYGSGTPGLFQPKVDDAQDLTQNVRHENDSIAHYRSPSLDAREALESAADDFGRDSSSVRAQPAAPTLRGRTSEIATGYEALKDRLPHFNMARMGPAIDAGGEHEVFEGADNDERVYKLTRPNFCGLSVIAMMLYKGGVRVTMDDATPPEYLERMVGHNRIFGDDVRLEGLHESPSGLHLVISQPLIEGDTPSAAAVATYLGDLGFLKTSDGWHWYRAADDIALADTKPANFIQEPDGTVHAVDVIVFRPTNVMLGCWGIAPAEPDEFQMPNVEGSEQAGPPALQPCTKLHVIGAGNFVRTMLLPHLKGKIELGTVVNGTGLSARHVREKFGFAVAETDVAALFEREVNRDTGCQPVNPERAGSPCHVEQCQSALLIGTRHHLHAPLVLRGLAADRHIFVEKPLCLTLAELSEIDTAIKTSKGSVMVGFNRRFSPAMVALRNLLKATPGAKSVAYHVFAGPLSPEHWYANVEESGGRVLGEACHMLDCACYLLDAKPLSVTAQTVGRAAFPDSVTVQVAFDEGSSFQLIYSAEGDFAFPKETLRVFGSGFVAECENFMRLSVFQNRKHSVTKFDSKGHAEEMAAWLAFLQGKTAHPLPYEQSRQSMLLTFAVLESIREHRMVNMTA